MTDFSALGATAKTQMQSQNFEAAVTTLSSIIDNLKPTNDQDRQVLYDAYVDRSKCYLELNRFIAANNDCNEVINDFKATRTQTEESDPLKHNVAKAYRGLAQIAETLTNVNLAIFNYHEASKYDASLGTTASIFSLLKAIGVPEVSQLKDEFPFLKECVDSILRSDSLAEPLGRVQKYLNETEITEELAKKLAESHLGRIIIATIAIQFEDLAVSKIALEIALQIAKIGIYDLFSFIDLLYYPMEYYRVHEEHLTFLLNILKYSDTQTYAKLAVSGFVHSVAELLMSDLSSQNKESVFFLLFQFAISNQLCTEVAEENVLPHIIKSGTFSAMMLFSRLSVIPQLCEEAVNEGILKIAFDLLASDSSNEEYTTGILIVFARCLLYSPAQRDNKQDAEKIFDLVVPILSMYYKSLDICANAFAALSIATKYAPNKIKDTNLIKIASTLLGIMINNANVAQNIVALFFECLELNLVTELKAYPAMLQTTMNALQKYPENQILVERCIALAIVLQHPHRVSLAMTAANRHPDSAILHKYIPRIMQ